MDPHLTYSRSKKEQERLHRLTKPAPTKPSVDDDLPSINSHSDGEDDWSSDIADDDDLGTADSALSDDSSGSDVEPSTRKPRTRPRQADSDVEMSYEAVPRKRRPSWDDDDEKKLVDRLPIKLADGRVQKSGQQIVLQEEGDESEDEDEPAPVPEPQPKREDIATGARFGRASVVDIIQMKSRKARVQAAKEQIASICQEIIGDPEDSVSTPPSSLFIKP